MSFRHFIQQSIEVLLEARLFKQALVPKRHHDIEGEGRVSLPYEPRRHEGGDLAGIFPISKQRYGLDAVEFAGHGAASALMTARVAEFLNPASSDRNFALARDEQGNRTMRPPDLMYTALNDRLVAEIGTDRYLTIILADVDPSTGVVTLSLAGRPGPAIPRADGRIEYASSFGMPIGFITNAELTSFQIRLETGDRLCSTRTGSGNAQSRQMMRFLTMEASRTFLLKCLKGAAFSLLKRCKTGCLVFLGAQIFAIICQQLSLNDWL
jgi:sigma-B regulation protein RsbU (phosphoserine phosphatase)